MKKIAMVICFFGKFPWYFQIFLHSCKFNSTIDFLIYTDDVSSISNLPENVKITIISLQDFNSRASEKLGLKTNIHSGYKLCDFKPAYGIIFSKELKLYDFWGHCDIDIILGDIRNFITDKLLIEYELISVRHDWLSGCFLLYKNKDKINTLFTLSKDYEKVFRSDQHYCFDETNFAHEEFSEGKSYRQINTYIESMTHVVKKMEESGYIKPFFDFFIIEGLPGKMKWDRGKLYYKDRFEVLFYHMIHFKNFDHHWKCYRLSNSFSIGPKKLFNFSKESATNFLKSQ